MIILVFKRDLKSKLPEKENFGFPVSDVGALADRAGSRTFGTVYHGKWRGTDQRADFWNEAIKLADLHHPNMVAFYSVVLDGPRGSVATVTEYMVNGSLRNALQKNGR
ncbi:hypothetical protein JHK82_024541 [Glycine max]|nr:hypothetical protein JHK86_024638 [Glycine max]KAG5133353.1 hypothetical protein JHK82_024541 [Glycine max]